MKKILLLIIALFPLAAIAQSTSVTATITDSDGQTWNNGTYRITFVPPPGRQPPFYQDGNVFTPQVYTGSLNGSGAFSISLPDNCTISPSGSKWLFVISPDASAGAYSVPLQVCGSSVDFSSALSNFAKGPRFPAVNGAYGYLDIEISPIPLPGGIYYNVTNFGQRVWDGNMWTSNGCFGDCIMTHPTGNQTITQPPGTSITFNGSSSPSNPFFNITDNPVIPDNYVWGGNVHLESQYFESNYSGQSRDVGNPPGLPASGQGWTSASGQNWYYTSRLGGISQGISGNLYKTGAGDFSAFYWYPSWMGGNRASSDEGDWFMTMNGGQFGSYWTGTVTSTTGTGDTHPVVTLGNTELSAWNYLVDTDDVTVSGNFAGTTTNLPWATPVGELPISNTVTPDTGRCSFGTPINAPTTGTTLDASQPLNQPSSHTITCYIQDSLPLTTGLAWIADSSVPEQINITAVTNNGDGTEAVTFTAAQAHSENAVIIQNPSVHGCLRSVVNYTKYKQDCDVLVFGAYDSTHLETYWMSGTQTAQSGYPFAGSMASKSTDAYEIHPAAAILAVNADGSLGQLETNDIPFTVGKHLSSPWPGSSESGAISTYLNLESPNNEGITPQGAWIDRVFGPGFSSNYSGLVIQNTNNSSMYTDATNPIAAPRGLTESGPFAANFVFDMPYSSTVYTGNGCDNTVLCGLRSLDTSKNFSLFQMTSSALGVEYNATGQYWYFPSISGQKISASNILYNGSVGTAGQFWRSDGSTGFVPSTIQAGDITAAVLPANLTSGTEIGGKNVCLADGTNCQTGVTVSGSACTITAITNGIVTAATCTP